METSLCKLVYLCKCTISLCLSQLVDFTSHRTQQKCISFCYLGEVHQIDVQCAVQRLDVPSRIVLDHKPGSAIPEPRVLLSS